MSGDVLVVIPARHGSTRFPAKVLAPLHGKPLLRWVWEAAVRAKVGPVAVATDHGDVERAAKAFGAAVAMTSSELPSGTDRVCAAVDVLPEGRRAKRIINLQGDEPLMGADTLRTVAELLRRHPKAEMSTAAAPIRDPRQIDDPNVVKVVTAADGRALYFSRSAIPSSSRVGGEGIVHWQHMGIYGYQKRALRAFVKLPPSRLERLERLEQLRALEAGFTILVGEAEKGTIAVDTPSDLEKVAKHIQRGS